MNYLTPVTFFIDYISFILVLWLGLYLVTHNPTYPISWLTALTMWSLAILFLHYQLEFAFWSNTAPAITTNNWFQGISVAPALAFWHHATMLMRPMRLNPWRWVRILTAYAVAVAAVFVQATTQIWSRPAGADMLYLSSRQAGPLFPVFLAALLVFSGAAMINLLRSARATPVILLRKQLLLLAWATLVSGLTIPVIVISMILKLPIPTTVVSLLLAVTVCLMGYGVARYSALMEGRTIRRDFFYNLVMVALVGAIYIPVCWTLLCFYAAPSIVFILIPCLAVFTHSLVNPAYQLIDRFLLRRETRQMRSDLRKLGRLAFESDALEENLKRALHDLCRSVTASYGIILIFKDGSAQPIADYQWSDFPIELPQEAFRYDDVTHLVHGQLTPPLEAASLLVPLYGENEQFGVMLLGHPVNGPRFADQDVERILNPAEMMGEAIYMNRLRGELMTQAAQLAGTRFPEGKGPLPVELVEDALRNLFDFAFLADSPLVDLCLVQFRLPRGTVTHLDRGKVVYEVLVEALNKLNPGTVITRDPPPREWYPYTILKEAYLDGTANRDIMMHLYISEGTFNRTRRAALRAVARTLEEMENDLQ